MAGTLRTRFALLYAGAFAVTGLVVLAAASLTVKSTVHAGDALLVVTRPYAHAFGPVAVILVVLVAASLGSGWLLADRCSGRCGSSRRPRAISPRTEPPLR